MAASQEQLANGLQLVPRTEEAPPVVLGDEPYEAKLNTLYARYGKRLFDVCAASTLMVVLAPVYCVAWVFLRSTLGKDVIFRQNRVGHHGNDFVMLKYRTMKQSRRVRNAHKRGDYGGPDRRRSHKSDADPRHTALGRIFRKTSLDELPQLYNVVRGDMSLVGPRPELSEVADRYDIRKHPRHLVKPGITGLWQVTERQNGVLLHESVDADYEYLDDVSFRNDISILLRTVSVLLNPAGR